MKNKKNFIESKNSLDSELFSGIKIKSLFFLERSKIPKKDDVKRGKRDAKLKFEALHLLDDVAVVNMRDIGRKFIYKSYLNYNFLATKNCFKILIFPDQRMFQCASTKEKRHWLEQLEESKKTYLALKSAQVLIKFIIF